MKLRKLFAVIMGVLTIEGVVLIGIFVLSPGDKVYGEMDQSTGSGSKERECQNDRSGDSTKEMRHSGRSAAAACRHRTECMMNWQICWRMHQRKDTGIGLPLPGAADKNSRNWWIRMSGRGWKRECHMNRH